MSRPSGCTVCHADALTWWHGTPVGPGWPTQASASPMCWYHDSVRMQSNGGLPVADLRPLDWMLRRLDREDDLQWARWRGLRDLIGDEDVALLEATR